jgi:hypothetical protein
MITSSLSALRPALLGICLQNALWQPLSGRIDITLLLDETRRGASQAFCVCIDEVCVSCHLTIHVCILPQRCTLSGALKNSPPLTADTTGHRTHTTGGVEVPSHAMTGTHCVCQLYSTVK